MDVRDEVCGMTIDRKDAAGSTLFQDKRYYFCSVRCKGKFLEHPDWYVPIKEASAE